LLSFLVLCEEASPVIVGKNTACNTCSLVVDTTIRTIKVWKNQKEVTIVVVPWMSKVDFVGEVGWETLSAVVVGGFHRKLIAGRMRDKCELAYWEIQWV
jgi:D-hexose-6-phosphate mutarotase